MWEILIVRCWWEIQVWWRGSSASRWTNIQSSNYNFYLLDNICYHLYICTRTHFDKLSQVHKHDNSVIISRGKRMFKTIWRRSEKTPQSPKAPFISCKGLMTIDKKFQLQFMAAKGIAAWILWKPKGIAARWSFVPILIHSSDGGFQ